MCDIADMSNIIDPFKPRSKVDKETITVRPDENRKAEKANWDLKKAGVAMEQPGYEYLGSMAVHVYRHKLKDHTFAAISQNLLDRVPEGLADFGFKELKKSAMAKYGRKEPEKRK